MLDAPITIRNLTAHAFDLKAVERSSAPKSQKSTAFRGNTTANGTSNDKSDGFSKQDVDVRLGPFSTHRTEVASTKRESNQILRLTFEGEGGGRWRVDLPTTSTASQPLVSLSPDSKDEYTAIYNPVSSFLSLHENTNLQCWMRDLQDETPLSALSIPGTHNSPTCHKALPSVRCQAVSPVEQLRSGVRFFDVRVQPANDGKDPRNDTLTLVHGAFPISLTGPKRFRPLLDEIHAFLQQNPSETVILSMKREGTGSATDQHLADILKDHYTTDDSKWYTEPRVPFLGKVRGKIVLMRRFALSDLLKKEHDGKGWALNAENWAYNTPYCLYGDVCVQDFCEVLEPENIDKKIKLCCDQFERAAAIVDPGPGIAADGHKPPPSSPLYLNYLSASNFWKVGCWPEKIAAKLNPAVTAFLCERHDIGDEGLSAPGKAFDGDGGVGIVVCDWVGKDGNWDLVRCIIGMNGRLLLKQRRKG